MATSIGAASVTRGKWSRVRRREAIAGILWSSPWLLGFLLFTLGPMVASLYLSFTDYTISSAPNWVGLQNFVRALSGADDLFWPSLGRTLQYALVMVPLGIIGSLLAAVALNQRLRGKAIYRTLFFLPSLTPVVASAVIWRWLFQPEWGAANWLLWNLGIQGPKWLDDPDTAMLSLMIMALWGSIGGSTMVIFLAGLQNVPQELYEAASIDGAAGFTRFRHVTLPMISPTMFFNLVIGIVAALKVFASAVVATGGGPSYATWFFVLHLYQNGFQSFDMGYASALAWIFFVVVMAFTLINIFTSRRWVYYEGEVK